MRQLATLLAVILMGLTLSSTIDLGGPGPAAASIRIPPEAHEITVPRLRQHGDQGNCGPTAAAMLLGAYHGIDTRDGLRGLRDAIGRWTWDGFVLRRLKLPGQRAGMTTAGILQQALDNFALYMTFQRLEHPFLPPEFVAMTQLEDRLKAGRPVITLMQSSTLWQSQTSGLHWVVVTGFDAGEVVFLDPADGSRESIGRDRFRRAWRLDADYRALPLVEAFTGLVADQPVPQRWVAAW
ncbi:MAG: ABC-type bacteriocin/lantibiotic exporter with double-glycine peptidase domain [Myxococcota bacterium]|jgi:ABC-type bacteriocin/lantibiotic exporter with double-glycine peptidase domain